MTQENIANHLGSILDHENIKYSENSIKVIAKAGSGSMRDALSLLDQAIAFCGNNLDDLRINEMFGSVGDEIIIKIIKLIVTDKGNQLINFSNEITKKNISIETLYDGLASLLHHLSLGKIDQSILENNSHKSDLMDILNHASAQQLQTLYQICINGKKDLYLAPDLIVGLNMTFLRMLAFYPSLSLEKVNDTQNKSITTEKKNDIPPSSMKIENDRTFDGNWRNLVNDLDLGIAKTLAKETELINFINNEFNLKISLQNKHLTEKKYIDKLEDILSDFFEKKIKINLQFS